MARPMVWHRGEAMRALLQRVHRGLPPLFGTSRPVYVLTCAATGAMEGAIRCATRERVLALVSGAFGERFARIAEMCGRSVTRLSVPDGETVSPEQLVVALEHGHYDAVTAVHVETSTGAMADLAPLARAVRALPDTLLLVDAVSSVGGTRVEMDALGLDVVLSASQKALGLAPGLSFLSCSARTMERARTLAGRGLYFDVLRLDDFWRAGETATTPAIPQLFALDAQLEAIAHEGLAARYWRHDAMRGAVERWVANVREKGVPAGLLAAPGERAPTVSCLTVEGDARHVVQAMRERGLTIGGGYGVLASRTIRIGHMGDHTVRGVAKLLAELEAVLPTRGRRGRVRKERR